MTGFWSNGAGRFVAFDQMDSSTLLFQEGVWETGGGRGWGTFDKAMSAIDSTPVQSIIYYPTVESETDGVLPELSLPVYLDMTDLNPEKILRVKLGEDGQWAAYAYAGDDPDNVIHPTW